jgi:hypothetical protein
MIIIYRLYGALLNLTITTYCIYPYGKREIIRENHYDYGAV